ncbi:MAG: hypothetical protein AB8G11_11770 [Saprospiraceae bacterium]
MRTLFFALAIFSIGFVGCKSTEPDESQQQEQQEEELNSRNIATQSSNTVDVTLKEVIKGFQNQDTETLNKYIDKEKGLYYIQSTQGAYSECIHYFDSKKVMEDSKESSEYDINPMKYLLDYFNNVNTKEMEVFTEDLFGVEACGFEEEGFFVDSNKADLKLLTDIYTMNTERDDKEIEPDELVKLGETQNEVTKTVFIGDGEMAYTFYFTQKNNKWYLTIMDLRDCDT